MKTTTYMASVTEGVGFSGARNMGVIAVGVLSALLMHRISVDGVYGIPGDRLPLALLGASAWLYIGMALGAGSLFRGLAHVGFGVGVFVAALAGISETSGSLAPWFLAQTVWILAHGGDGGKPRVVLGWAVFNAAMAAALTV